jgi:hypothetical protein
LTPLTDPSRSPATAGRIEDLGADLSPGTGSRGVALVFGEAPLEFRREFGRDWQRLVRTVLGDGVPEVLDELEALGDSQATQRFEVERRASHAGESENGGGRPQAGAC